MCSHASSSSYPTQNLDPGNKWIKHLTRNRTGTFVGGHYSGYNLTSVLFTHRLDNKEHVRLQVWSAPGLTKPSFEEAMKQTFKPAQKGDSFGPSWTNHWWKVSVTIPGYWSQYERVQFEFDPGCEAMIYTTEGLPLQGITGGYGGDRRVDFIIPVAARAAGTFDFIIESTCNGMFGVPLTGDTIDPPDMNRYFSLASADLVVPNQEAWDLLWDFQTLREIVDSVPGNTPLQNKALVAANQIMNVFESGDLSAIRAGRKIAEGVFGEGWAAKGDKVYKEGPGHTRIWGIGHCHIDTAWLWPYHVTQQKVARSWSTQVDLMNRYPEHRFSCSQAQQYKWLEKLYPPLFEAVKEKVLDGRFHPVGGSWVENDANMPSGEALVRQFLFGQNFFQSRFGKRCDTAWLPDSFGLTGALPQLIRGAGMSYFFTQKMSWNNINVFPHSTFNWVGIDGTQVLCHMTPVDTYTAQATVGDVQKGLTNHKNLESGDTALLVFGNGDGGGGPLNKMLENLRRIRAASNEHRELPKVSMGSSIEDFFKDVMDRTSSGKTLPNWHGELYLEFHRGTYTSHASIKKGNRHSEILLRDVEHLSTLASLANPDFVYPKQLIDECWEKVLLNQFHDVLPGSAIGMVYDDAEILYAEVKKDGEKMIEKALEVLYPYASTNDAIGNFNTTFFPRREIISVPASAAASFGVKASQSLAGGKDSLVFVENDGNGFSPWESSLADPSALLPVSVYTNGSDNFVLRNSSVQLTITNGRISSLLDVQLGRELLAAGSTGGLIIFEDRPAYWDAWDVEVYHLETGKELAFSNVSVVAQGPLRASLAASIKYGKSQIDVLISLDAVPATIRPDSRSMFTFSAKVDWRQRHEFLKFELPLDIHSDNATYETQFGWVQRPTHKNTTWDAAKFEVCGHKYADLSEFGYGVAILSESKYGFSCLGNVLRISLLRSSTAPDAEQDQGEHEFSFAVLPHVGHFLQSDVPQAAFLFNSPTRSVSPASSVISNIVPPSTFRPDGIFRVQGAPNVFLETIKRGENDDFGSSGSTTTVVLRLYEAFGGHASAQLAISKHLHIRKAAIVNLLEDEEKELGVVQTNDSVHPHALRLKFHGFQVVTVKLTLEKPASRGVPVQKKDSWIDVGFQ
ncbi:glycosyl hydrolases family 38 N-terminal domain-containing protein [Flagelloscypha sp. PMI_526]|nr:glycosyl hydrolases family 38 N-terminal domain-containing protein [Flagelloscypha sp. PMI_526]